MNKHTLKQSIKTWNKKRVDKTWCKKSMMKKIYIKGGARRGVDDKNYVKILNT